MPQRERVLFICTHNSARSQMAEGLLRHLHGDRFEALSGGVSPTHVHPAAVDVMAEIGIDIAGRHATHTDALAKDRFEYVITVCDQAKKTCPVFPGAAHRLHWSLPDPSQEDGDKNQRRRAFRGVRDGLKRRLEETFG